MSRLQSELQRLYPPSDTPSDAAGPVRVLMLGLARPAEWELLSQVWRGVQADLGLPAPAIAVSGSDGFQLWFSLAQAVPRAQALQFLDGLRQRYWPEAAARRVSQWPGPGPTDEPARPCREVQPDQWSAFVSPDLAPVFAETPWLDIPPVDDGQAQLLRELQPITQPAWASALADLVPAVQDADPAAVAPPAPAAATTTADAEASARSPREPRQFLLEVMNDPGVDMALRLEAARILLSARPA